MYYILIVLAKILIFLTTRYTLIGKENIPGRGPILVLSNHLSVADPVLIGASIGHKVVFMAKEELFKNFFVTYIIRSYGAFPVYRSSTNLEALREASSVLKSEQFLGMFPEGKRSQEAALKQAFIGSALIARRNRSPILPVAITGSEKIRGLGWIWHRPKVNMKIGRPFTLSDAHHKFGRDQLNEDMHYIMKHISELLPESYRGEYASNN